MLFTLQPCNNEQRCGAIQSCGKIDFSQVKKKRKRPASCLDVEWWAWWLSFLFNLRFVCHDKHSRVKMTNLSWPRNFCSISAQPTSQCLQVLILWVTFLSGVGCYDNCCVVGEVEERHGKKAYRDGGKKPSVDTEIQWDDDKNATNVTNIPTMLKYLIVTNYWSTKKKRCTLICSNAESMLHFIGIFWFFLLLISPEVWFLPGWPVIRLSLH